MPTVFKTTAYNVGQLVDDIALGDIALPDIQRPFVWYKNKSKVRDLFDSIYKGFPVGYLLFWENSRKKEVREIGSEKKQHAEPHYLIIDGQQRLTSLFAVMKDQEIVTPDFSKEKIKIAFSPITGDFAVADAATDRDPTFIPNISELWRDGFNQITFANDFIENLKKSREVSNADVQTIQQRIVQLINIREYPFTALEISADNDEERVADIFVRINSKGEKLTQADFVLTLLSVFWEEGRQELERFCAEAITVPSASTKYSSYNHIIKPDPSDMLRTLVGLCFRRGRMRDVYALLRGRNMETRVFDAGLREQQFERLKASLPAVLDNTHWMGFLKTITGTGYKSSELISSANAVIFSYITYLIGKVEFGMDSHTLQSLTARWFFMCSLTGRYSSSPETRLEEDMNRIKSVSDAASFKTMLEKLITDNLGHDFWEITLVNDLESSSVRTPAWNAYVASLIMKGSPVLFSQRTVSSLFEPSIKPKKKQLDRHHLFPKNYLVQHYGLDSKKDQSLINQVGNLTYLEFEDNIEISDAEPKQYCADMRKRYGEDAMRKMYADHALPEGFENMEYEEFLPARRKLMAKIIRGAFEKMI